MVAITSAHIVIFPFLAKGHTIPLLYLARILWQRRVSVTVFTTPANSESVRTTLHDAAVSVIELPFPQNIDGIPPGVESTDKLLSMALFTRFANATKLMQPLFEQAIEALNPVSCIISDTFLGWTQDSAEKLGIPRIGFYGMSTFGMTMYEILGRERPHAKTTSLDEPFSIPNFPKLKLTRDEFDPPFNTLEPEGEYFDFIMEQVIALSRSFGILVNSFYELESSYADYWNKCLGPKAWCIGPFCVAKPAIKESKTPKWMQWLDENLNNDQPVLYVAFGTQSEVSQEQLGEVAKGLEDSKVSFLWVSRSKEMEILKGFEERVMDRGLIVKEWVDQIEILQHKSIKGFLSHCGWNSVTESLCSGVPVLALPFMAEQHLNARLVTEEIGIGLRLKPSNGTMRGLVDSEEVERKVRELMNGKTGEVLRKKVNMIAETASSAMSEGGSSWQTLEKLIHDVCDHKKISLF